MNKSIIVGKGNIASVFLKNQINLPLNSIIYAKGCSNSQNNNQSEFNRDFNELKAYIENIKKFKNDMVFVYFSTYSISDSSRNNNLYVRHKLKLERFITNEYNNHIILRIPEVISNPIENNNVLNYLYFNLKNQRKFDLWVGQLRNFIKLENIFEITNKLLSEYTTPLHRYFINDNYISIEEIYDTLKESLNIKNELANRLYFKINEFNMSDIPIITTTINKNDIKKTIKKLYK